MRTPSLMTPATSQGASNRVSALDGLRGIAVLLVIICHIHEFTAVLWPGSSAFGVTGLTSRLLAFFWVGVDLFYVLSGFFIGSAVLRSDSWNAPQFLKNRLTRIVPAYYVSMVIAVLTLNFAMLSTLRGWIDIGMHATFLHNMQEWTMFSINGPYWTLGVEFAFYILMLATGPLWRTSRGWLLVPLLIGIALLWRAGVFEGVPHAQRFFFASQLPGVLDEFALGIAIAIAHQRGWFAKLGERKRVVGLITLVIGTLIAAATLNYFVRMKVDYWEYRPVVIWGRTLMGCGFALMLVGFLCLAANRWFQNIIRYSSLGWIGSISYSAYLYHATVIILSHRILGNTITPGWPLVAGILVSIALVSFASYQWVEKRWHANL